MPDIKMKKEVVIAPLWNLGDHFLRFDEAQSLSSGEKAQAIANIGGVSAPSSTTDNAIARFDGTSGQIQNSGVIVSDTDSILTANGTAAACGVGFGVANTGFHRPLSSTLSLSINGTDRATFHETNGLTIVTGQLTLPSTGTVEAGSTLFLKAGSTVRSETIRDSTTAAGANVFINSTSGILQRSTSALKYKDNITPIDQSVIEKTLALDGISYTSKCEGDDPERVHFGVVADQADEIGLKELVTYGGEGGSEIEGFQYERLVAVLLEVVKQQEARITALETAASATGA